MIPVHVLNLSDDERRYYEHRIDALKAEVARLELCRAADAAVAERLTAQVLRQADTIAELQAEFDAATGDAIRK